MDCTLVKHVQFLGVYVKRYFLEPVLEAVLHFNKTTIPTNKISKGAAHSNKVLLLTGGINNILSP